MKEFIVLILLFLLSSCAPGQNGPVDINAYDSCVLVYISGSPTGGTPTITATVPISALPGIRGILATDVTTTPYSQTCTVTARDVINSLSGK